MELAVGSSVGPYRLVEHLGAGNLATVFKAFHPALDRYVALKALHPALAADAQLVARFQHEARLVARLDHPNIVPVHDFAEQDGVLYLVMKYVAGETLRRRLGRGPLPPAECARVLGAAGAALHYAHGLGLPHGDLKPTNLLLAEDGNVFVSDFGVGRLPTAGLPMCDPEYASPEQLAEHAAVDAASDQYSLGVILFEALTSLPPFQAAAASGDVYRQLVALPPRPSALNPDLPAAVDDVVLRALSRERSQRYAHMAEFVTAFQQAVAPPRPPTAPLRADANGAALSDTSELPPGQLDPAATVIMLVTAGGQMFRLAGQAEYSLGRAEPNAAARPDVDLAESRGVELGVSRAHGRLHFEAGRLYYTDLRSTNGSRVNGARLYPEVAVALSDGDELALGRLTFRVYFGT